MLPRSLLLLVAFGFFKEMKPSEPFLTPYLVDDKDISNDDVNNDVYPVWTYSYLAALAVTLLVTDMAKYTPIVLLEALSCLVTRVLLLWGSGVRTMQFMQFAYGVSSASDIAFYTTIYALSSPDQYDKYTSLARATILAGQTFSGVLAQVLVSAAGVSYLALNYISFVSVSISVVLALLLMVRVRKSNYEGFGDPSLRADQDSNNALINSDSQHAHKHTTMDSPSAKPNGAEEESRPLLSPGEYTVQGAAGDPSLMVLLRSRMKALWRSCAMCYGNRTSLRWSAWWILATCGDLQVENYMQTLWEEIDPDQGASNAYNGGVTAAATCLGIAVACLPAFVKISWSKYGEAALALISLADCAVLLLAARATNVWVAYAAYVVFAGTYTFLITVISAELAKSLARWHARDFAFIFGLNMFGALALQTILTAVVNTDLNVSVRRQFVVYALFFGGIACLFLAFFIGASLRRHLRR